MPISTSEIAVGNRYVTALGEVRRVLSIERGNLTYESVAKTDTGGSSAARTTIGAARFAADAVQALSGDETPPSRSQGWT